MAEFPERMTIELDIQPRWRGVVTLALLVFAVALFASLVASILGVFLADAMLRMP